MAWLLKGKSEMDAMQDFDEVAVDHKSLAILKLLDGLTVGQARHVLHHIEDVLGMATRVDCASASFEQAVKILLPKANRIPAPKCERTAEQLIAADVSAVLIKHRSRNPGELADGLTAALMAQVPPSVAIQALSVAIGK